MLSRRTLLSAVRELGPFADETAALRAMLATLGALGEQLTSDEIAWLSEELDEELAGELASWIRDGGEPALGRNAHDFVQRVAAREAVWIGLATEHAEVVLGALGRKLPLAVLERLERHLPELVELFSWRDLPKLPPVIRHRQSGLAHDLAEGRPGGTHPLASSDTRTLAHRHSVARSDDPHAESKLSSSTGLTQEREGRTLASGHPGADNPISRGH